MLTDLDAELFPDDCEVVEIPLHNRHVYLIQKNGSSSLRKDALARGWRIIKNHDLWNLDSIDIYLRDPVQRYLSGVNTFVQHMKRDFPAIDQATCEVLVTRHHFLNRHYLPQWHWLVNLARFIDPTCKIRLHPIEDLYTITDSRSRAKIQPLSLEKAQDLLPTCTKLEFWFLLDRILLGRCGQTLTWQEILYIYKEHPVKPLEIILDRVDRVRHVLS